MDLNLIDMNTGEGYKSLLFPDGQPHITVKGGEDAWGYKIICSLTSAQKLLELCMVADATQGFYKELHIPYLMGARYDRIMEEGGSFDLRVVAKIINSCKFDRVTLFDPHSDVSPALIERCEIQDNRSLVVAYDRKDAILIIPDAGAAKKAPKYFEWNSSIVDSIQCIKHRDLSTGKLTLKVLEADKCIDRNCVVIDDLCDGGRTFVEIGKQLPLIRDHLTLIVTHGVFSQGFDELRKYYDLIITSNSYADYSKYSIVEQIPYNAE